MDELQRIDNSMMIVIGATIISVICTLFRLRYSCWSVPIIVYMTKYMTTKLQRHSMAPVLAADFMSLLLFHCNPPLPAYSSTRRNRSAFAITDTELNVIAALAIIGLSRMPKNGYSRGNR